jgi:hypothetical protein
VWAAVAEWAGEAEEASAHAVLRRCLSAPGRCVDGGEGRAIPGKLEAGRQQARSQAGVSRANKRKACSRRGARQEFLGQPERSAGKERQEEEGGEAWVCNPRRGRQLSRGPSTDWSWNSYGCSAMPRIRRYVRDARMPKRGTGVDGRQWEEKPIE